VHITSLRSETSTNETAAVKSVTVALASQHVVTASSAQQGSNTGAHQPYEQVTLRHQLLVTCCALVPEHAA
jgi:hypothetical protein